MKAISPIPADVQCRVYIAELAGVIGSSAEIIQRYAEIGDDVGLEYQLKRLVLHVKATVQTFKDLAALDPPRPAESEDA